MKRATLSPIAAIETYLSRYVTFQDPMVVLPLALWVVGTYLWDALDVYPYLCITSDTKRSGKTRLAEALGNIVRGPRPIAGMTPATIYHAIADANHPPTLLMDEAETLHSEASNVMRAVLNVGYRRGATIPRMKMDELVEYPTYCPKVFVLIGDVYDTLRDRSIVVRLRRSDAPTRWVYDVAKREGAAVHAATGEWAATHKADIVEAYHAHPGLDYLTDRDAEIWLPLFAIAALACPDRLTDLARIAVDLSTEKTATARRMASVAAAERSAEDEEYALRALADVRTVMGTHRTMHTAVIVQALHDLPTGPWRKYHGVGLTAIDLANLLARFGVQPKLVKIGGRKGKVLRGYHASQLHAAPPTA